MYFDDLFSGYNPTGLEGGAQMSITKPWGDPGKPTGLGMISEFGQGGPMGTLPSLGLLGQAGGSSFMPGFQGLLPQQKPSFLDAMAMRKQIPGGMMLGRFGMGRQALGRSPYGYMPMLGSMWNAY